MIELETKLKNWGNSLGIVVPINKIKNTSLKNGSDVKVFLMEDNKVNLKKLWGKHKFSKPINILMKEIDKELYNE